ncbi:bile acid:sodium symporter family protein [uncultured Oscillibacter sp.]|uniref:bile acid:sodium symporter family protein n=1 Tax=uncultured Oscillibacter sp. TaxID=876091 RepID=UPI0025F8AECC|nr:bile acid:sodium symporter family protein [uncultured Oscillibacter sp.]
MKAMNRAADLLNKNLALLAVAVAAFALVVPSVWVKLAGSVSVNLAWVPFMGTYFPKLSLVNLLLGVIMFGMGMTLRAEDFALILRRPRDVLIGICSQYVCMAGFGWLVAKQLTLTGVGGPEVCAQLAVGLVLLGCVPGGTASNVMTFLARGDVPLSITITMCTTLLAPALTPALTLALAGQWVEVNFWSMFFSIVVIVLLPIFLGLAVHAAIGKLVEQMKKLLVLVSTVCILLVIGMCVGPNQSSFTQNGLAVVGVSVVAVLLHHVLGLLAGYGIAKVFHFNEAKVRALSLEVGLQNSGLACTLANSSFPGTMAILPCVLATVIHQVVGPIVANMFAARDSKEAPEPRGAAAPSET